MGLIGPNLYNPETKYHPLLWKTHKSQNEKTQQSTSKFKAMLLLFFYIKGVILENWVLNGVTVNQHFYNEVLETL